MDFETDILNRFVMELLEDYRQKISEQEEAAPLLQRRDRKSVV